MTEPTRESPSSVDSVQNLWADWTFDREDSQAPNDPPPLEGERADESELVEGYQRFALAGDEKLDVPLWASIPPEQAESNHGKRARPDRPTAVYRHRPGSGKTDRRGSSGPIMRGPQPGEEIAGFRVITELGRGAFAGVYLAEELNLGRRLVAIKVSRPDGEEPRILARLQHAHIVPVHSVCDDPASGLRVLCMPYFGGADLARVLRAAGALLPARHDGGSLVKALDRISHRVPERPVLPTTHPALSPPRSLVADGAVPISLKASRFRGLWFRLGGAGTASPPGPDEPAAVPEEPARRFLLKASAVQAAAWIVARLAEGLEHAHARGLLHRDLKPSNILLAADGTPMLLDFNLSVEKPVDSAEGEVDRALVGGTLPYMSPEHLDAFNPRGMASGRAIDERSDIYALGLIFFELLTGEAPFPDPPPGTPLLETLNLMIACRRQPPSLRARRPHVPWSLDALASKCMAFDPKDRYAHARDLAEDLRRFLDNLPMKHCPEPSVRERMGKWASRHPGLCGSTSIALVAMLLLGTLLGTFALVYDRMQGLSARVRYRLFDRDFTETQFLLNTAGGLNEHLRKGIDKAAETLGQLGPDLEDPAFSTGWARRLPPEEACRLREQIVEIIMLDARAGVLLSSQAGSGDDRRRAISRAIARLDHVEHTGFALPSAFFAERARFHAALGDLEHAQRDRARSLQIPRSTCHDLTLLATSLLSGGDHMGAEKALQQALCLDPTSFWAWFVLGHCHFAQGRYLESAGDFGACIARGPGFAWAHFNRGLALARAGRPLEARFAYTRAIELDPSFSEALVNRAMIELELDQLGDALHDLVRSIELGRDDLVALTALGETWSRMGRRADAERFFAGLLARNPRSIDVLVARGFTRITADPAGARADLRSALDQNPRHAHALYGMALVVRAFDLRKACELLDRAIESDSHLIDAVQLRALVRARLAEPAALDDVDRLIQSPTPHRLYNAACALAVYAQTGRDSRFIPRALDLLRRAIEGGFPPAEAAHDPDLGSLRGAPEFKRLVSRETELRLH